MKKKIFRVVLTVMSAIMLFAVLSVVCSAEKTLVAEGYCVKDGTSGVTTTNVKWEIFAENGTQTIYFSIDKSKTEGATTVLYARNKDTGATIPFYQATSGELLPWGSYVSSSNSTVTKAVIGDGITEINGAAFVYSSITTLEIPKSLVTLETAALNRMLSLDTVNITGEEANPGVVNLKYVTTISNNALGGENRIKKYVFNPDYVGKIGDEVFSKHSKMKEIEFPAGVTSLGKKIFTGSTNLAYVRILGKETVVTNDTFGGLDKYPRLVGYVGSAVETFAKENGYTFINIETNEVVHEGTKPLADIVVGEIEDKFVPRFEKFDPIGATAYGHLTASVIDTYWVYYQETKTLKFVSNTTSYNETGRLEFADDGKGWVDYVEEIEHIVIGDYIEKPSNELCVGMINLKSIELSRGITQVNESSFAGCENLTTIYCRGREKIEGHADFSCVTKFTSHLNETKIKVLKLGANTETLKSVLLPPSLEKIITPLYGEAYFDTFCKENMIDLEDANNPENVKKYYVDLNLDPNWPMCGPTAAYEFNEATGTLTVHGKGIIDDIDNYYGGGSKYQPWFEIRDNVKHIVITKYITTIGKYAFCEFANLETVCLPNVEKIEIMNAAFEKCYNLKAIYVDGSDPIEGTFDLRLVKQELYAWTFAYDYLVANIIVDESVAKIGKTTFEENLGVNLKGVYGVPGSFAEEYASENGLTFYDISKGMPTPVTCTAPESKDTETSGDDTTVAPDSGDDTIVPDTTVMPDTTDMPDTTNVPDTDPMGTTDVNVGSEPADGGDDSVVLIVVIVVVVLVVAACVTVLVIKAKKPHKNKE